MKTDKDVIVDDNEDFVSELGDSFKNLGSNVKNLFFPRTSKSGRIENKKVRITKYKDYDKKVVTYKIVTMIPKNRIGD